MRCLTTPFAITLRICFVLLFTPDNAAAGVVNAASCLVADVSAAVAKASDNDQVNIPPGDCVWTTQLTVTKGIVIAGAGEGQTILRDNVTKNGSSTSRLILFNVSSPATFRLTALSIVGQATDPNIFNQGHIYVTGTTKAFRIDHLTVTNPQTSLVRVDGDVWGVIDHVTLTGNRLLLQAGHSNWGGGAYGDGSWAAPLTLGTEQAIYVEDNVLTASGNPYTTNFIDSLDGARLVVRSNTIVQGNVTSHGTDTGGRRRSVRSMEIYNNTFSFPDGMAVDFIVWMRGGTGTVFNNTVIVPGGLNKVVKATNCRDAGSSCGPGDTWEPFGTCNGTSPYDSNQPGQNGYRCVDQPGAGTSRDLNGLAVPSIAPVANASEPFYVWANVVASAGHRLVAPSAHVQENRDYYVEIPRPGYSPYTYPHPLTRWGSAPTAPKNVRITGIEF